MKGGENKKSHSFGYTIIEVMLFLAISGFMFVLAAIFINGKQANAEFTQGVNGTNSQIRAVMNDVINGFYPSNGGFSCSTGSSGPPLFTTITSKDQGENLGCVFIGKVMQFGGAGTGSDADGWTGYSIYSVAGRQYANNTASQAPTSFADSQPKAIDKGSVTETGKLQWGMAVTHVCSPAPATGAKCTSKAPGAIGFFGGFGSFDSSNNLQSGSQSVNVALIPNSKLDDTDEYTNIQSLATAGSVLPNPDILVCLTDSRGRVAGITIGGANGQQLATNIKVGDARC